MNYTDYGPDYSGYTEGTMYYFAPDPGKGRALTHDQFQELYNFHPEPSFLEQLVNTLSPVIEPEFIIGTLATVALTIGLYAYARYTAKTSPFEEHSFAYEPKTEGRAWWYDK